MKKREKIQALIAQIDEIIASAHKLEKKYSAQLEHIHPAYKKGARNLIHYRALRKHDLRILQKQLGRLNMSRLANAESHVMAALVTCKTILEGFIQEKRLRIPRVGLSVKEGRKLMKRHSRNLLGYRSKGRRTRIMVTLPTEAATDYQMVYDWIKNGMNCARINCAHDNPLIWLQMIQHVRKASKKLNRNCKISMDLGGPKIRTGPIMPGPRLRKYRPVRNTLGQVVKPAQIWLSPYPPERADWVHLPVSAESIDSLALCPEWQFRDARNKKRRIKIIRKEENGLLAHSLHTAYVVTDSLLVPEWELAVPPVRIGEMPALEQKIRLHKGDLLVLDKNNPAGQAAQISSNGQILSPARISCTSEDIFLFVQKGERILFDDGKIEGIILDVSKEELLIEITGAGLYGSLLKADKGINFPDSQLEIRGLTAKDREDLAFVVEHADMVNMSFVNSVEDVNDLLEAINELKAEKAPGIIFKIETQSGFNSLTEILLAAMQAYPVGVMVARGDLAIEVGWDNMARVQEETLSLCRAAHIPDIWATQVLENLAKKGLPSRAEITDAGMGQRAECVMLNKGPRILEAIRLLDIILKDRYAYMEKGASTLPILKKATAE